MQQLDRAVGGVHPLAARTAGAADAHLDLVRLDFQVNFLGLRQNRHAGGGGVDSALGFGLRHALDPVHPALVAQFLVHVLALDREHDLLEPAPLAAAAVHQLNFPSLPIRVAAVHPIQVGGEQRRFLAAGAGTDLHDRVARVMRVRRDQPELDLAVQALGFRAQRAQLRFGQLCHLRVVAPRQFFVLGNLFGYRVTSIMAG